MYTFHLVNLLNSNNIRTERSRVEVLILDTQGCACFKVENFGIQANGFLFKHIGRFGHGEQNVQCKHINLGIWVPVLILAFRQIGFCPARG